MPSMLILKKTGNSGTYEFAIKIEPCKTRGKNPYRCGNNFIDFENGAIEMQVIGVTRLNVIVQRALI